MLSLKHKQLHVCHRKRIVEMFFSSVIRTVNPRFLYVDVRTPYYRQELYTTALHQGAERSLLVMLVGAAQKVSGEQMQ